MTTEAPEQKVLSGAISDISFKYTGQGTEYVEVSLDTGGKYPVKSRAFDEALVQRFHNAQKGQRVGLVIEEEPGGEYKGKPFNYRNIVGITAAGEDSGPQSAQKPAQPRGGSKDKGEPGFDSLDPVPYFADADKYAGANIAYEQWKTDRRTALMQSVVVDPANWHIVADEMFAWLRSETEPPEGA